MKAFLLRLALITAALVPVTSALAADLEAPPPVDDLRPATYDWTGLTIGAFAASIAVDGHYDATNICGCVGIDPEMSGIGYGFGVKAGFDYQVDSIVMGIQGDWTFGGEIATNDDPAEATYLNMNNFGTLRARVGVADGNTLLYATGGLAMADMEFGGLVGSISEDVSDAQWAYGWTVGAGIEHAFSDSLTASLEYLYVSIKDTDHTLINSLGEGGDVAMKYNDMHVIRAGLNYRFSL